jgi:hypothetical protein
MISLSAVRAMPKEVTMLFGDVDLAALDLESHKTFGNQSLFEGNRGLEQIWKKKKRN